MIDTWANKLFCGNTFWVFPRDRRFANPSAQRAEGKKIRPEIGAWIPPRLPESAPGSLLVTVTRLVSHPETLAIAMLLLVNAYFMTLYNLLINSPAPVSSATSSTRQAQRVG